MADDFLAEIILASSLNVVTADAVPVTVVFEGILDLQPPMRQRKKANYTPISGTHAGKEQVILASEQAATIEFSAVFEAGRLAAIDAQVGKNGCAITLNLSDGSSYVGVGGIEKAAMQRITDSKEAETQFTLAMNAGWVYSSGSTVISTVFQLALVAGAKTLDLTAIPNSSNPGAPIDATGKKIFTMIITNPSTNANNITVAKGASNGHTGLGSAFSLSVAPGNSSGPLVGGVNVGSSDKTLDFAGTLVQVIQIQLSIK